MVVVVVMASANRFLAWPAIHIFVKRRRWRAAIVRLDAWNKEGGEARQDQDDGSDAGKQASPS